MAVCLICGGEAIELGDGGLSCVECNEVLSREDLECAFSDNPPVEWPEEWDDDYDYEDDYDEPYYGEYEDEDDWDDYDADEEPWDGFRDDVEADADVLRMAGYGTDEDYGYYGD